MTVLPMRGMTTTLFVTSHKEPAIRYNRWRAVFILTSRVFCCGEFFICFFSLIYAFSIQESTRVARGSINCKRHDLQLGGSGGCLALSGRPGILSNLPDSFAIRIPRPGTSLKLPGRLSNLHKSTCDCKRVSIHIRPCRPRGTSANRSR